jgi:hypothetical protein
MATDSLPRLSLFRGRRSCRALGRALLVMFLVLAGSRAAGRGARILSEHASGRGKSQRQNGNDYFFHAVVFS